MRAGGLLTYRPYIDEEEGAVEIAQTVGRSTLADAISGTARI